MTASKAKSEKLPLPKSNPDLKVHNLEISIATLFPQTAKRSQKQIKHTIVLQKQKLCWALKKFIKYNTL